MKLRPGKLQHAEVVQRHDIVYRLRTEWPVLHELPDHADQRCGYKEEENEEQKPDSVNIVHDFTFCNKPLTSKTNVHKSVIETKF